MVIIRLTWVFMFNASDIVQYDKARLGLAF